MDGFTGMHRPPLWSQPQPIFAFPEAPLRQLGWSVDAFEKVPLQEVRGLKDHLAAIQEYLSHVSKHLTDDTWLNVRISDRLVEHVTLHRWDRDVVPHTTCLLGYYALSQHFLQHFL